MFSKEHNIKPIEHLTVKLCSKPKFVKLISRGHTMSNNVIFNFIDELCDSPSKKFNIIITNKAHDDDHFWNNQFRPLNLEKFLILLLLF